jgi:spore maturation protein CgeB
MKVVLFCHSMASCWNHGNAHFMRGVARELIRLGNQVLVYEPADGWSRTNLLQDHGAAAIQAGSRVVPGVDIRTYNSEAADLAEMLDGANVVIVHEWTDPEFVADIGECRIRGGRFRLFFHDTHHRAVTAPDEIERFDLEGYDAVLAFGEVLRQVYVARGWGRRAFTWHEAADAALFRPSPDTHKDADLIWIGNWGDGERDDELQRFLIEPVAALGIRARIHGVRYPEATRARLQDHGINYCGWLPNHKVPEAFARARVTVHIPRRPYVDALPGIPTIRMFEALACGMPLVSAPWHDVEGLFPSGAYMTARNGREMIAMLDLSLRDPAFAIEIARAGAQCIQARHTCRHRVEQLLEIIEGLGTAAVPVTRDDQWQAEKVAAT